MADSSSGFFSGFVLLTVRGVLLWVVLPLGCVACVNRDKVFAPCTAAEAPRRVLSSFAGKIRIDLTRDKSAPRQIRTAAPASGGQCSIP